MPFPPPTPLCPELTTFHDQIAKGEWGAGLTPLAPGIELRADPRLQLQGTYRTPAERFLELEATVPARGDWAGLHIALPLSDLSKVTYVGLVCRHAAPNQWMIRPCLRSGLEEEDGFVDCFFDRHILTDTRPRTHVDVLYTDAVPDLPMHAPWRELILFLPTVSFRLNIQNLFPFAL